VTIAFVVGTDGVVDDANVASSSLGKPDVEECMLKTFRGLRFPTAEKRTGASFPFVFRKR
jgi:TonB family protein